ncbi:MAG: carboxylesterase [Alphaproteobacteria bacterium]|nr:MAG: carboxylesterase [Alphaproteobacteria bacterium]
MGILSWLFGGGIRTITGGVREVAEVFRPNAEADAQRAHEEATAARAQYAAEFLAPPKRGFDVLIDGLNRIPRPALALGCIGLFVYAMADPLGFAARMQGLQLVPDPLWWLLGAIVSFYFGARELHHFRENRAMKIAPEDVARTLDSIERVRAMDPAAPDQAPATEDAEPGPATAPNPAIREFRAARGGA